MEHWVHTPPGEGRLLMADRRLEVIVAIVVFAVVALMAGFYLWVRLDVFGS